MRVVAEAWRAAASLFAHWSPVHAAGNLLAISGLASLIARRESWRVVLKIVGASLVAQLVVLLAWAPSEYRGASGLAYGLAAYAAAASGAWWLLVAGAGWITLQGFGLTGSTLPEGVQVAWPVHIAGAAGALAVLVVRSRGARVMR